MGNNISEEPKDSISTGTSTPNSSVREKLEQPKTLIVMLTSIFDKVVQLIEKLILPIAVLISGHFVTLAVQGHQSNAKMAELAVDILKADPKEGSATGMREWAIDVVNNYSGVTLSEEAANSLIDQKLVVASEKSSIAQAFGTSPYAVNVAFWNIRLLGPRDLDRLQSIANIIALSGIDVLATFELDESTAAALSSLLKKQNINMDYFVGQTGGDQRVVIFFNTSTTKVLEPVREIGPLDPTVMRDGVPMTVFRRRPVYAKFRVEEKGGVLDFSLIAVHLRSQRGEAANAARLAEANYLAEFVETLGTSNGRSEFVLLGGDMNCDLDHSSLVPLTSSNFLSAVSETGNPTFLDNSKRFSSQTLDHIFATKNIARLVFEVDVVKFDKWIPDYNKRISDHRPVTARILYPAMVEQFRTIENVLDKSR